MTATDLKKDHDFNDPTLKIFVSDTINEKVSKEPGDQKKEFNYEDLLASEVFNECEIIGRYLVNVFVNVINLSITNTCLIYVLVSTHNNSVRLHILCSVLGFQLCMNQGILVLSKYNYCMMHFSHKTRRQVQWYLQAVGSALIVAGSIIIVFDERANTYSPHGICGISAVIAYLLIYFNDRIVLTLYLIFPDFKADIYVFLVKCVHYIGNITAILLYGMCLSYGIKTDEFMFWAAEEEIQILILAVYIVTALVIIEFLNTSIGNIIEILGFELDEEPSKDTDSDVYIPNQSKE